MEINTDKNSDKKTVFKQIELELENDNFSIAAKDDTRPWGGFFCN